MSLFQFCRFAHACLLHLLQQRFAGLSFYLLGLKGNCHLLRCTLECSALDILQDSALNNHFAQFLTA